MFRQKETRTARHCQSLTVIDSHTNSILNRKTTHIGINAQKFKSSCIYNCKSSLLELLSELINLALCWYFWKWIFFNQNRIQYLEYYMCVSINYSEIIFCIGYNNNNDCWEIIFWVGVYMAGGGGIHLLGRTNDFSTSASFSLFTIWPLLPTSNRM